MYTVVYNVFLSLLIAINFNPAYVFSYFFYFEEMTEMAESDLDLYGIK
jgi:hypothetical protein